MRPTAVFILIMNLGACASVQITQRAADDLPCPAEQIQLSFGAAGAVKAYGCGDWIQYACASGENVGLTCVQEARGTESQAGGNRKHLAEEGRENGSCFGNQTCFAPLSCVQGICLRPAAPGMIGGACIDGTCRAPLACVNAQCEPVESGQLSLPMGTRGGACYPNPSCNAGLTCQAGICAPKSTGL